MGIVLLVEVDPCGAARGHDGDLDALVAAQELGEAVEELVALLHNGDVCTPVGIEYIVEADCLEGGRQFAGDDAAGGETELLSEGYADCRGNLYHGNLVGVVEVVDETAGMVGLGEGTNGAYRNALAAEYAVGVEQVAVERCGDHCGEAAVNCADCTYALVIVAYRLATAAHDALAHVADDGGGYLYFICRLLALVRYLAHAELDGHVLKLALAALGALQTVVGMVAQHELEHRAACVYGTQRVGLDDHVLHTLGDACRGKVPATLDLDHAHTASAGFVLEGEPIQFEMAKGGNLYTKLLGSLENGGTLGNFYRPVVNCQFNICHS